MNQSSHTSPRLNLPSSTRSATICPSVVGSLHRHVNMQNQNHSSINNLPEHRESESVYSAPKTVQGFSGLAKQVRIFHQQNFPMIVEISQSWAGS